MVNYGRLYCRIPDLKANCMTSISTAVRGLSYSKLLLGRCENHLLWKIEETCQVATKSR